MNLLWKNIKQYGTIPKLWYYTKIYENFTMEKVWYMKYTETIVNYVYLSFIKGMLTKFILHGI